MISNRSSNIFFDSPRIWSNEFILTELISHRKIKTFFWNMLNDKNELYIPVNLEIFWCKQIRVWLIDTDKSIALKIKIKSWKSFNQCCMIHWNYFFAIKFLVMMMSPLKELHYANQELMRHRFHLLLQNLFWQEQVRNPILDRLLHYLTQHVRILLEHSLKWSKQNSATIQKIILTSDFFHVHITYSLY